MSTKVYGNIFYDINYAFICHKIYLIKNIIIIKINRNEKNGDSSPEGIQSLECKVTLRHWGARA